MVANLHALQLSETPDPFVEIADLFLEDTTQRISQLEEALRRPDSDEIRIVAHTIKGGADNLGARRLASLCRELEQCARTGDLKQAADLLVQVKDSFSRVAQALEADKRKTIQLAHI
jgi:HPt (histidine-containing phosphotransfer) domain-containing protein